MDRPTETTAAKTDFCAVEVHGPGGTLWFDGNGKITAGNGTLTEPKPNAFSLVQIKDCPGSTASCRAACYVHNLERHKPEVHRLYQHNSEAIRKILKEPHIAAEWAMIVGRWISENCRGGFRWHVSGDIFSIDYAEWIASVCWKSPQVRHWIYTKSLQFLGPLIPVHTKRRGNLSINLSADQDNWEIVGKKADMLELRVCYMTIDGRLPLSLLPGDVIFPDYALRGGNPAGQEWFEKLSPEYKQMVCPVDYHGKAENRRCGPCNRCLTQN